MIGMRGTPIQRVAQLEGTPGSLAAYCAELEEVVRVSTYGPGLALAAFFVSGRAEAIGSVPEVGFVENLGQYDSRARYVARLDGATAFFTDSDVRFALDSGEAVFLRFDGSSTSPRFEASEVQPGLHHFFHGNDPSRWVRNARAFAQVILHDVYPGVDVRFRVDRRRLEYDVILQPGADVEQVRVRLDGVESLDSRADGTVVARTKFGQFIQSPPVAYSTNSDSAGESVTVLIDVVGESSLNFLLPGRTPHVGVLIDPSLSFASYLGWSEVQDLVGDAAVATSGSAFVAGTVISPDFPISAGAFSTGPIVPPGDIMLVAVSPDGSSLIFSAAIGGNSFDSAAGIHLLPDGRIILGGYTESTNFPVTTTAYQKSKLGYDDSILLQLSADGSTLIGSTYFGALGSVVYVSSGGLAVDSQENCHIVGEVITPTLPVTPDAVFPTYQGLQDCSLAILSSDCSTLKYCTYIGSPGGESRPSVAVDGSGGIYVSGGSFGQFPVTPGAFDTQYGGNNVLDMFLIKLKSMGQGIRYATYLGGSNNEQFGRTAATLDGRAVVAARTNSSDFPTTPGSFDPTYDGIGSIFVTEFNTQGSALTFSGFVHGGSGGEQLNSLKVDVAGGVYAAGRDDTPSLYPTTSDAFDSTPNGQTEAVFCRIDPSGSSTVYGTYLGGSKSEFANAIGVNSNRRVVLAGVTNSNDLPTTPGVFQPTLHPSSNGLPADSFVAVFDLCNGSFTSYGSGCTGSLATVPTFAGAGCPAAGGHVTLTIDAAHPGAPAILLLGLGQNSLPLNGACALQIAPLAPSFAVLFSVPTSGAITFASVLPVPLPKAALFLQALIGDPGALGGIAATAPIKMLIGD